MSFVEKFISSGKKQADGTEAEDLAPLTAGDELALEQDPELQEALSDFRMSVSAWSEAAYQQPRTVVAGERRWRLAAGWALGGVLALTGISGGVYGHLHQQQAATWNHHLQQEAKIVTTHVTGPVPLATGPREQRAHEDEEDLLAKVDSDVARQVPSAMEPLAQLMTEDEAQSQ